jgi:acetyltransferase-like isoleucine patch superfamily enzyme
MTKLDIFQRELAGEVISLRDPEYPKIAALIAEAQRITAEMNTGYRDPAEVRLLFSRLTGATVDESFWLLPPFYTDFGKNIRVGRNVFINHACEFMDRGGITIGDDVLIGPKVSHGCQPQLPMWWQFAHRRQPSTLCSACAPHSGHFLPLQTFATFAFVIPACVGASADPSGAVASVRA